jgi:hypothetical protein
VEGGVAFPHDACHAALRIAERKSVESDQRRCNHARWNRRRATNQTDRSKRVHSRVRPIKPTDQSAFIRACDQSNRPIKARSFARATNQTDRSKRVHSRVRPINRALQSDQSRASKRSIARFKAEDPLLNFHAENFTGNFTEIPDKLELFSEKKEICKGTRQI